jgi:alpha-methylacyl-CoA racemase
VSSMRREGHDHLDASEAPGALEGIAVVTLALNVPGPVAAARLRDLGARVTKIEPPQGDPLASLAPRWHEALHRGCSVKSLDLKTPTGRTALDALLQGADLLLTSSRPSALARLGLGWGELHARHPELAHVAIIGAPPPDDEHPGHDLTFVAQLGLVEPPALPRTLLADLAGAERAAGVAAVLLLRRARGLGAAFAAVSLREAARPFRQPLTHGLTAPGSVLGGGSSTYRMYRARDAWIALAALEPHFVQRLCAALGVETPSEATLTKIFAERDARDWELWASQNDVPLAVVASR